jgi:hypothetical protein
MVVLEGTVVERPAQGRQRVVSVGHLVGGAALTGGPATADGDAVAQTEVRLLVFGPEDLRTVADLVATAPRRMAPARAEVRRRVRRPVPVRPVSWAGGDATPSLA